MKNPDTLHFELVNRAYETFIGMPRENLIGKTVHDVFRRTEAEAIVRADRNVSNSDERVISSEFALNTPANGEELSRQPG